MPIKIAITTDQPHDVTKRRWGSFTKIGNRAAADYWQTKFLPRHFARAAHGRYRYQDRRRQYRKKKRYYGRVGKAKKGGRVAQVWTGLMERMFRRRHMIKAYPTRFTIHMIGPRYISMRPKDPRKPWKAAEIMTVLADEERAMGRIWKAAVQRQVDRFRARRTKKVT